MTSLSAAISWSGSDVVLSLFVVWPPGERCEIVPPRVTQQPRAVRRYELEDVGEALGGRATSEIDLSFDKVPNELDSLVADWLAASIEAGGVVAWFGLEGSFDFQHVLAADVADQIYGVAVPDFIALATDDHIRVSDSWIDRLAVARRALR